MGEHTPGPHPFDGQFESAAEAVAKDNPFIPLPEIAQASIAISLKRIADAWQYPSPSKTQANLADILAGIEMTLRGKWE